MIALKMRKTHISVQNFPTETEKKYGRLCDLLKIAQSLMHVILKQVSFLNLLVRVKQSSFCQDTYTPSIARVCIKTYWPAEVDEDKIPKIRHKSTQFRILYVPREAMRPSHGLQDQRTVFVQAVCIFASCFYCLNDPSSLYCLHYLH